MSQSKLSVTDDTEMKFVIKHVFKDVKKMKAGKMVDGPIEYHFNIPWKIRISREDNCLNTFLDCMVPTENADWSIVTETKGKTTRESGNWEHGSRNWTYHKVMPNCYYMCCAWADRSILNNNKDYIFEFTVIIKNATGLDLAVTEKLKNFDDDLAREDSDVTLIVKDQKFHVHKVYLSHHSTYFKALFSGNFAESQNAEIELKDIEPEDFQYFLEFLYAESSIKAHSVLKILHLADFFNAKTAIRRCQEFLVQKSTLPLNQKFEAAIKYNLEELKAKCISDMNSAADFQSIVPENGDDMSGAIWKEVLNKAVSLLPK